jgi:hypothetical protein
MVSLTSRDSGLNMPGGRVDSEGKFEIQNVLPGSYFLAAGLRAGAERPLSGRTPIVVGDVDLDNLSIVLSPGEDIPGQIVVEGNPQQGLRSHPIITLQSGRSVFDGADFANNTTFTIHNVVEGDYDLRIYDVGQNQYIKSIRFGSADISNGSFHVDERNSGTLEFVLGTTTASIDGLVRKANGGVGNMRVTLIPDAAHVQRADLYRSTSTADTSGRFHFEAVAPGNYTLFAWEDVEEGIWHDPEFVKHFENLGTPVHIDEASNVSVELHPVSSAY